MEQDAVPADGTQADCLRAQFHRHERKAGRVHPHAVKGQFPGHDLRGNGGENLELVHERHPEFFQPFQAYIGIRNVREYLVIGTVHRFQRRTAYLRRPQFPGNGLQHQAVALHGRHAQFGGLQPIRNVIQRVAVAIDGGTAHFRCLQTVRDEFQCFAPVAGRGKTKFRRFHRFGNELDVESRFLDGETADLRRFPILGQRLEKVLTPRVLVHPRIEIGYIYSLLLCHGFQYLWKAPG